MQYIYDNTEFKLTNTAVTLGKFDGLHLGHQLLIHSIMEQKCKGLTTVMFTFHLHPSNIFSEKEMRLIDTEEERRSRIEQAGFDYLIAYPFTQETASMNASDFILQVLVEQLGAKVIVVGSDFRFGKNRVGDVKLLESFSKQYGFEVISYPKVEYHDTVISSSTIREQIFLGNIQLVNEMLGRPYSITGTVVHGRSLGRTLGVPTANLVAPEEKLLPPNGVYVSKTICEGKEFGGITNIGVKPTVADHCLRGIETYLFDFEEDIYGKEITVELLQYQRGEQKFHSLEQLQHQMEQDITKGKEYLNMHP